MGVATGTASGVATPTRLAQIKNSGIADATHRRSIQERRPKAAFAPMRERSSSQTHKGEG